MRKMSKNEINEIRAVLNGYRKSINEIENDFQYQASTDYEAVMSHKDDYKKSYLQRQLDEAKIQNLAKRKIDYDRARKEATDKVSFYMNGLYRRFGRFYAGEIRPEIASIIQTYTIVGYEPSMIELELMADKCKTYAEAKAFTAFLDRISKPKTETTENPYMKGEQNKNITVTTESWGKYVDVERFKKILDLDAEKAYRVLDEYRDVVENVIRYYCAGNRDIFTLTGEDGDSANYEKDRNAYLQMTGDETIDEKLEESEVSVVKDNSLFYSEGVSADRFWNDEATSKLEGIIEQINSFISTKTEITKDEEELLDTLFSKIPSYNVKDVAQELSNRDGRLSTLIELSPRYSKYLDD